jgi:glucose/arabinose dehydrogenase/plastocyanin
LKTPRPLIPRYLSVLTLLALAFGALALGVITPVSGAAPTLATVPNDGTEDLPPGTSIETVLPNMVNPIALAFDPAGRLFYTEKTTGNVRLFAGGSLQSAPVINFSVTSGGEQGLLGIAVDPDFNTNHYIYVYYTCSCTPLENRVVRFVENNGVGSNPVTIFTSPNGTDASNHNGGNIHFGPDGKLYISLGDDGATPSNSQNVTVKQGKIHRINPDGSVPPGNPVFTQTGALPTLYAMGLRNTFDFDFDPLTPGRIFASENGPGCDDELNRIEGGYNYGWRPSYPCDDPNPSPTYNTIPPLWFIPNGACCEAPTGIMVYSGHQIPQWTNDLFMVTYNGTGTLRHYYLNDQRTQVITTNVVLGVSPNMDLITGPDGAFYFIDGGGYSTGTLYRIVGPGGTPTATVVPPSATRTNTSVVPSNTTVPATATRTNTGIPATSTLVVPTATRTATPTGTFILPTITLIVPSSTATTSIATGTSQVTNTPGPGVSTATGTARPSDTTVPTETATATATACAIQFTDVPPDNTFYPFVTCLACRGILSGYQCGGPGEPCDAGNNPYFRPYNNITRGQIAKVVSNAAGLDKDPGEPIYADVPSGHPFYSWINRLTLRGYMGGYECGGPGEPCNGANQPYFRPYSNATRGQLSKIVSNAANYSDTPTEQFFEDVPPSHPFYVWIQRLASRGIMSGYPCGGIGEPCGPGDRPYFRPGNEVTRGQASKIVANTFRGSCPLPAAGTVNVEIEAFAFQPMNVTVSVGTTVRWFNYDLDYHTATSGTDGTPDGRFDTSNIGQYESGAVTFTTPGSYPYYCRPHPYMTGTITITP